MKKLLKVLEAASVELGELTQPPWCSYTECVARVRDEVRVTLVGLQPIAEVHEKLKGYGESRRKEAASEAAKGNSDNAAECRGASAAYLLAAELIYQSNPPQP